MLTLLAVNPSPAQNDCHFGSAEAFDQLAKALEQEKTCEAAAKRMHDCAWGSSADTQLAPIVISKCEKTFFPKLSSVGKEHYADEMQLCAYEYSKAEGTISMSAAALCQLDVATEFAGNANNIAEQPIERASFDCGKAETPLETAICSDRRLGHADVMLGRVYRKFLNSLPKERKSALIESEKQWMKSIVQDCGASHSPLSLATQNCVANEFENRFTDLDSCFDSPEQHDAAECLRDTASTRQEGSSSEARGNTRASFDCEQPKSSLQMAICADASLGQKDIELSEAYAHARETLAQNERRNLEESQREWLHYVEGLCPMGATGGIPPLLTRLCVGTAFETRTKQLGDCMAQAEPRRSQCLNDFRLATSITIESSAQNDARTDAGQHCKQTSFGACRTIRGRYGIYAENNGIVDLGSHELLSTAGDQELDAMIRSAGGEFDHEVLGEFVVCPTSAHHRPERTRAVQDVCVQSHKQIKVVKSTRK